MGIRGGCNEQSVGDRKTLTEVADEDLMFLMASTSERDESENLFSEVYSRYHNRVVGWCSRVVHDRESAMDLAQEIFLKAWRHRGSFRGDSRLSTWLYAITRNHCLTMVRMQDRRMVPIDPALRETVPESRERNALEAVEQQELSSRMLRLMSKTLEPMEVRVMALHYGHEVPLAVITRELRLTNPSGAKAYIVNARRKLQGAAKRRGWELLLAPARRIPDCSWMCQEAA